MAVLKFPSADNYPFVSPDATDEKNAQVVLALFPGMSLEEHMLTLRQLLSDASQDPASLRSRRLRAAACAHWYLAMRARGDL